MDRFMRSFIKNAFHKYPIASNSILYGTLFVGAELSQQTISKKIVAKNSTPYDTATIARYVVYGTGIGGPYLTYFYTMLDKKFIGTSLRIISRKLLVDQFIFTPSLLILFFITLSVMEGKDNVLLECREKFPSTFRNSCMFWIPVQTLNFLFVPPVLRVAYIGICSFAWVNILCWIKRQNTTNKE